MGKSDLNLIKEISRLTLKKGDILVIKLCKKTSPGTIERMSAHLKVVMKKAGMIGVPFLLMSDDVDVKVICKE